MDSIYTVKFFDLTTGLTHTMKGVSFGHYVTEDLSRLEGWDLKAVKTITKATFSKPEEDITDHRIVIMSLKEEF